MRTAAFGFGFFGLRGIAPAPGWLVVSAGYRQEDRDTTHNRFLHPVAHTLVASRHFIRPQAMGGMGHSESPLRCFEDLRFERLHVERRIPGRRRIPGKTIGQNPTGRQPPVGLVVGRDQAPGARRIAVLPLWPRQPLRISSNDLLQPSSVRTGGHFADAKTAQALPPPVAKLASTHITWGRPPRRGLPHVSRWMVLTRLRRGPLPTSGKRQSRSRQSR